MTSAAFDPRTGELRFDDGALVVHRRLRRGDVAGVGAEGLGRMQARLLGVDFAVKLEFSDGWRQRIKAAEIGRVGGFDPQADREFHDHFVAERLGLGPGRVLREGADGYGAAGWAFRGGSIESVLVPQDLNAYIRVAYR